MGAVGARHGVVIYRGTVITAQHLCAGQGVPGDVHDLKYSRGGNGDNVWDMYWGKYLQWKDLESQETPNPHKSCGKHHSC